jgi:hypothetical protein
MVGRRLPLILDDVQQTVVFSLSERSIHRQMTPRDLERVRHLEQRHVEFFREFTGARLPFEFLLECAECFANLVQRPNTVQRQAHDAGLLRERLQNRLSDPPNGVGDELESARLVESLRTLDESEVPFVDQISKGQALMLVLLGDADDKTEIGLGQLLECLLIPLLDSTGKVNFFLRSYKVDLPYLLEVLVERLAFPVRIMFNDLHYVRLYLFINENLLVTRPLQQFERLLGYNEAMFAEASRSWDEWDQVLNVVGADG